MLRRSALFIVAMRIIKTAPAELPVHYSRLLQSQIVSNFNCYKQGVLLGRTADLREEHLPNSCSERPPAASSVAALTGHFFGHNEIL
jgi:hypothetical protein